MDRCLEVWHPYHRTPSPWQEKGGRISGEWELAGGWSRWAPLAVFGGGWEAIALSDMCHKCLAFAWFRGSVPVVGSGGCRWGSSTGSSAVIVWGAWKTEKRAWRLEGDLVPAALYLRPTFGGRKGIGALRKELWGRQDYPVKLRLPGGSGSGWAWRTRRLGHGDTACLL